MVQPQAAEHFGLPLSLFTYEPELTAQLNQALYQVTVAGAQPSATGHAAAPATNALTFHYAANGLDVVKTFRFDSSYVVTIEAQVKRNGAAGAGAGGVARRPGRHGRVPALVADPVAGAHSAARSLPGRSKASRTPSPPRR